MNASSQPAQSSASDSSAAGGHAQDRQQPSAPIDSSQLLRGNRMIEIAHEGAVYRLQATRLGKLILTK